MSLATASLPRPSPGSLPARAGSPLTGRVSHPLDDERSFMESSHPSIPFDQQGLVALNFLSVFEIFQTGRGVRRDERSHGIGLAIVKKIAEAHAGKVWVESELGRGARFHVLLPNT